MDDIVVDLWGDLACFTRPDAKVERYTYSVPTPSALRGLLASIYSKPAEFYWLIRKIEVMNPIKYMTVVRNEVNVICGRNLKQIDVSNSKYRAQRSTVFLKDVRYRVTASIIPQIDEPNIEARLRKQAIRRIKSGQCFLQPYLGLRECICNFALSDLHSLDAPINLTQDFGLVIYDTHVPSDNRSGEPGINTSLYHCFMTDGTIIVPDYDSDEVIKVGGGLFA